MPSDDDKGNGRISWRQATMATGLALAIPELIGAPTYLGYWLDKKYSTGPLWLILGLLLGLVSAGLTIYKLLKQFGQFK
jgi:F0F1-type ATP synthase assembly protein I